jgi:hypothetical protein
MIKEPAYVQLGPWPVDLQLIIFSTRSGWRCGLSPAAQTSDDSRYRETVLKIANTGATTPVRGRDGFKSGSFCSEAITGAALRLTILGFAPWSKPITRARSAPRLLARPEFRAVEGSLLNHIYWARRHFGLAF